MIMLMLLWMCKTSHVCKPVKKHDIPELYFSCPPKSKTTQLLQVKD